MAVTQIMHMFHKCGNVRILGIRCKKQRDFRIARFNCSYFNSQALDSSAKSEIRDDLEICHIPTTALQKFILSVGCASVSLLNPRRPEMIAVLGETTGSQALKYIHEKMENDKEGREILSKRPRINSRTVDLMALSKMPEGTLGKVYSDFLAQYQITPDSRQTVQFVDDSELAYVMQRYREVHDLVHTILNMPTNMLGKLCRYSPSQNLKTAVAYAEHFQRGSGEVAVKWVEGIQTRLPMCLGGALFGPLRLGPKQRQKYKDYYLPWAIETGFEASFLMNVFFENRWDQPVSELLSELNVKPLKQK